MTECAVFKPGMNSVHTDSKVLYLTLYL